MASLDRWFVRMPDGRTLRARSTDALRGYVRTGRVPRESRVRQSDHGAWLPLESVPDLTDVIPSAPVNEPDKEELKPLGFRGFLEEIYLACDSSFQRENLKTAGWMGGAIGLGSLGLVMAQIWLDDPWLWLSRLGAALLVLIVFSVGTIVLTQRTYIELARLRPATSEEVRTGTSVFAPRLFWALLILNGLFFGLLFGLDVSLSALLRSDWTGVAGDIGQGILMTIRMIVKVLSWPVYVLSLFALAPMMVVEEISAFQAMREWLRFFKQHRRNYYLYESFTFALAFLVTLPLLLPIELFTPMGELHLLQHSLRLIAQGLALTPGLALLCVANVHIYLYLRYESSAR